MVLRIGLEDILDQLFLRGLQVDGRAVDAFLAFAGFALAPECHGLAGGVVADDDDGDIGGLGRFDRRVVVVVEGEVHLDAGADLVLDSIERSDRIGERAAIPVPGDVVGPLADHRDGLQLGLVQRQQVVLVLQKHDRLLRHLAGQQLVLVPASRAPDRL